MRRRTTLLLLLLVSAAFAAPVPAPSLASSGTRPPSPITDDPTSPNPAETPGAPDAPVTVMLELAPVAPAGGTELAAIAATQQALTDNLNALGIPVLFQTRAAYSGLAVAARPSQIQSLHALPGVAGVHVIPPKRRGAHHGSAVTPINAAAFWSYSRGRTGDFVLGTGVRIGVIDSGIDYTHATFGGPGTPEAYAANDSAEVEPGSFPTEKVVGGLDFVGDAYDASGPAASQIPAPDLDPLDCSGQGTQVASIAAGYGVRPNGSTYRGRYSSSITLEDFKLGPGVAPQSELVALKIFGCSGTTTFLSRAIDYAIDPNGDGLTDDRLVDVLNISLGTPFGGADDPDAVAVERAVRAGVTVVVAAGDSGEFFYSVSSPASSPLAIAVGASESDPAAAPPPADDDDDGDDDGDDHHSAVASGSSGIDHNGGGDDDDDGHHSPPPASVPDRLFPGSSRGPQANNLGVKPDLVAPGNGIPGAAFGSGSDAASLSGTAAAAPQVAGAVALLHQLHPEWSPARIKSALVNTSALVRQPDGTPYPTSLVGGGRLDVGPLALLDLIAYPTDDPDAAAFGFGAPWLSQPLEDTRSLTVENTGRKARTFSLGQILGASENGVQLSVPPGPYTVGPGQSIQVPVTLSVQPQLLDNTPDASTVISYTYGAIQRYRYFLPEHSGYISITSTLGSRVRAANATDVPSVKFYLDDKQLGDALTPGNVGDYATVTPGTHRLSIKSADCRTILEQDVTFEDGRDYSLVLWGNQNHLHLRQIDELAPGLPNSHGLIHFFNADLYGDGSAVDFYIDNTLAAAAVPAGEVSAFVPIQPGERRVRAVRAGQPVSSAIGEKIVYSGSGYQFTFGASGKCGGWQGRAFATRDMPINRQAVRVPFQIFPKSAAESAAVSPELVVAPDSPTVSVPLRNTGARNGSVAGTMVGTQLPLVSAFEMDQRGISPRVAGLPEHLRLADLQYVGVTNNLAAVGGNIDQAQVFFGISTYAPWSTPSEVQVRVVIDTNGDGAADHVLLNLSQNTLIEDVPTPPPTNVVPDDVFRVAHYELFPPSPLLGTRPVSYWGLIPPPTAGFLNQAGYDTAPFNSRVMIQIARAGGSPFSSSLRLSLSRPSFRYYVETYARDEDGFTTAVDRVPSAGFIEYNLLGTALTFTNQTDAGLFSFPLFAGVDGATITGDVNQSMLSFRGTQPVLLLHHHNDPAHGQAELLMMQSSAPLGLVAAPEEVRMLLPIVDNP